MIVVKNTKLIISPQITIMPGILIAAGGPNGGNTVEMFFPSTGKHCRLPDIPGLTKESHSVIGTTICGGYSTKYECVSLIDGAWKTTARLQEPR